MPTKMVRQTRFSTGEVDEVTWKRTDINEYMTAAQKLTNFEVGTTGLARKRKGTKFLLNVSAYANPNSRLYDIVDQNLNHYVGLSSHLKFYIFNAPTESVNVVTVRHKNVVTIRGTDVVAREDGMPLVQTLDTPYPMQDLDAIDYAQDNDTLILTHPDFQPARILVDHYTGSTPTFRFEYLDIYPLPAYDFNRINYNNFTVDLGGSTTTILTFKFTGVGADPGFTNDWIGGQIIGGGNTPEAPIGYAIITAVSFSSSGGGTVTFTATVQIAFEITAGLYATKGSQYSIRQPAFSATLGYPAKVLFYQNRLWFANTRSLNNTIFGSKINTPISFDVGSGKDTDAIIYTIGQTESGAINWLNAGKQLEIFCQNYEFACPQDQNTALTPSTFSIRQQTSFGASQVLKPLTYINDTYYANKTGKALINFHFNGVGLTYKASNISAASSHLVKTPTNRALLRGSDNSQDNFIYFLNPDDSTLTAFQFAEEYNLAALSPVVFQDNIGLVDIVTIANEVYLLKYYDLTNTYAVEQFVPGTYIDSYRQASLQASGLITGLDDFNGYNVQVIYQNQDFGTWLVANGKITILNPTQIADTVFVGLLYDLELRPMYPFDEPLHAPYMKNLTRIYVDYYQSLDFFINGKLVQYQNFADIQASLPLQPETDTAIISPVSGWSRGITGDNDAVVITQSSPFDLQILGIGYQIESAVI